MSWAGHAVHTAAMRNAYAIFVGIPERKRPLGSPRHGHLGSPSSSLVSTFTEQWILKKHSMRMWGGFF